MRNVLLVIVAPFALAACAANLDSKASKGEARAVEIIPVAPVACTTLLFTTCAGGWGACYAGCYAAARTKD